MSDAFDVFDPFEPLEAAGEPAPEPAGGPVGEGSAGVERVGAGESSTADESAAGSPEPSREPGAARRWSAPAGRPMPPTPRLADAERTSSQHPSAHPRPDAPSRGEAPVRRLPTGEDFEDALDAVLFGPRGSEGESGSVVGGAPADGPENSGPASPPLVSAADLAAFRAVALPELTAAVERLSARGHLASLADDLDREEPVVTVLFRPDQGPLAAFGATAREPARFDLRLSTDLDGEVQVVAGYTLGAPDAPFTLLSRTRLATVRADWVVKRFVEFVQRVLRLD